MNDMGESHKTELLFDDFIGLMPEAIIVVNSEGKVVQFNNKAENLFDYKKNEVLGKSPEVFIPDRYREMYMKNLKVYLSSPHTHLQDAGYQELILRRKEGDEFPASISFGFYDTEKGIALICLIRDITKHKKTEETLHESEMKFRSVVQSAVDAIILADSDGNIISWNKGAKEIFGFNEEEVLGKPLTILMPERYREGHIIGLERVRTTGKSSYIGKISEMAGLKKDGAEFPLELSRSTWKVGDKTFYSGIIRDITERKNAYEVLRVSESKYRGIFENAAVGIFQTTLDGRILAANPVISRMLGYDSPDELMALVSDFRKLFVEPGIRIKFMHKIREENKVTDFEVQVSCKDGSSIWVLMNSHALHDSNGKITGLQGILRDVSNRKRTEKNFQGLIESISDAIITIDNDFNILLVNARTEKIFGYSRKELVGKPYNILIPERFREIHNKYCRDYFARPFQKAMAQHSGTFAKHRDGTEFPVEINISPLETESGTVAVLFIHEIMRK